MNMRFKIIESSSLCFFLTLLKTLTLFILLVTAVTAAVRVLGQ